MAGIAMDWLFQLYVTHPVAKAIGNMALVCCAGMALGSVKVRGVGLGTAGTDAPTVAYATVYPLAMILRILCAQLLALSLMS